MLQGSQATAVEYVVVTSRLLNLWRLALVRRAQDQMVRSAWRRHVLQGFGVSPVGSAWLVMTSRLLSLWRLGLACRAQDRMPRTA
eukprot:COSAG06_NODE_34424_length_474_cov_2.885333_1_plen_84_part_01